MEWAEDDLIPMFNSSDKPLPTTDGPRYRMDFYYDLGHYFVCVECDEKEHGLLSYPPRCELVRMYRIALARQVGGIFVRYNPDSLKIDGVNVKVSKVQRESILLSILQHYFQSHMKPSAFMTIIYICYTQAVTHMHGELYPYTCTQTFETQLDYEAFVGSVYPNDCQAKGEWYKRD